MPSRYPIGTRDLAKALFIQGLRYSQIETHTGVKAAILRNWARRYNWNGLIATASQIVTGTLQRGLAVNTANTLQAMGDQIRDKLSQELLSQVQLLAQRPPSDIADLATVKGIQGRASVVKTIAETAAVVHDWGSQTSAGLVLVGELSRDHEEAPAVTLDIPAELTREEPAQLAPPDTTTGSVPDDAQSLMPANPLPLQG